MQQGTAVMALGSLTGRELVNGMVARGRRGIVLGALACTLCAAALGQGTGGDRVALVIGNSGYVDTPLPNPRNDARQMAQLLTQAGFQVDSHFDTSQQDLLAAV